MTKTKNPGGRVRTPQDSEAQVGEAKPPTATRPAGHQHPQERRWKPGDLWCPWEPETAHSRQVCPQCAPARQQTLEPGRLVSEAGVLGKIRGHPRRPGQERCGEDPESNPHAPNTTRNQPMTKFWEVRELAWAMPPSKDSEKLTSQDFSEGPGAKTPCCQCRGHRFNSWLGN